MLSLPLRFCLGDDLLLQTSLGFTEAFRAEKMLVASVKSVRCRSKLGLVAVAGA